MGEDENPNRKNEEEKDKFAITKAMFELPAGMIYMDGNSLGPLPKHARARLEQTVSKEWGKMLISIVMVRKACNLLVECVRACVLWSNDHICVCVCVCVCVSVAAAAARRQE